jgi:hypothetical protein
VMMPCRYCTGQATRATLSMLGARCQPCYEQYLRLGYGGAAPPKQFARSPVVAADAARVREYVGAKGAQPSAFAGLSAAIEAKRAERSIPQGLADEDVNALLQSEGS